MYFLSSPSPQDPFFTSFLCILLPSYTSTPLSAPINPDAFTLATHTESINASISITVKRTFYSEKKFIHQPPAFLRAILFLTFKYSSILIKVLHIQPTSLLPYNEDRV